MAGRAKDRVEEGKDPGAEKKAAKAAAAVPANDLIETVAGQFISRYVKRQLKAGTASRARSIDADTAAIPVAVRISNAEEVMLFALR